MSGDDNGDVTLDQMIRSLERTPEALRDALPAMANVVKRYLVEANAAGVTPDNAPYQRTADGQVPLREGAKAISVRVEGGAIVARVRGVEARHSLGTARGGIARPMLPEGETPPAMTRELERVVEKHMREVLG